MSTTPGGPGGEHRPTFGKERLAEETRERFVREVIARVPLTRLVELHLFAPMRQGGMESGVAVLAATLDVPAAPPPTEAAPEIAEPVEAPVVADEPTRSMEAPADAVPDGDPTEAAAGPAPADDAPADDAPVESEPLPEPASVEEILEAVPEQSAPVVPSATRRRHTVFTARYRLVLKGPERGKWEVEVREEADAPLITVEAVVRGVQQRSGDTGDPERLDAAGVARMLGVRLPEPGEAPPAP